jgi:hypothetical protein
MDVFNVWLSQFSSTELAGILSVLISVGFFILVFIFFKRRMAGMTLQLKDSFALLETRLDHSKGVVKDEMSRNREETALSAMRGRAIERQLKKVQEVPLADDALLVEEEEQGEEEVS